MTSESPAVNDAKTMSSRTGRNALAGPTKSGPGRKRHIAGAVSGYWWWAIPAVLLVGVILYLSIGAGAVYAFTNWDGFSTPKFVGIQNFISILSDPLTRTALLNTVGIAIAFVIFTNLFGLGFALALNRQLKTRHLLRVLLFAPVVLSALAVSYLWQFIFQQTGPLNEFLASVGLGEFQHDWLADPHFAIYTIIIVMVWQNMGLVMLIYLAGLANVPPELEEASALDGATGWKRFWSITVYQIRPSVVIASALMLIQGLKVFDQVIGLTNGGPYNATQTLATQIWQQTFVNGRFGYGAALSLILTIIVIVFALIQTWALRAREDN